MKIYCKCGKVYMDSNKYKFCHECGRDLKTLEYPVPQLEVIWYQNKYKIITHWESVKPKIVNGKYIIVVTENC